MSKQHKTDLEVLISGIIDKKFESVVKDLEERITKPKEMTIEVDDSNARKQVNAYEKWYQQVLKQQSANLKKKYVSDENILSESLKRQKKLSEYKGQSSDNLTNATNLNNQLEQAEKELKNLIHSEASFKSIKEELSNCADLTEKFNTAMSVVGSTMEKSLSTDTLSKQSAAIERYIKNAEGLSESQKKSADTIKQKYAEGMTSSGKTQADIEWANLKAELDKTQSNYKKAQSNIAKANADAAKQSSAIKKQQQAQNAKDQDSVVNKALKAEQAVSISELEARASKYEKILSKYTGQSGVDDNGTQNALGKMRDAINEVHKLEQSLSTEVSKGASADVSELANGYDKLTNAVKQADTAIQTVGNSFSKNLDTTSLQKSADRIQKLIDASKEFASTQQLDSLTTLQKQYSSDAGMTKESKYSADQEVAEIEKAINARKKLLEVQKELEVGTYSASKAGYQNTLSKYEGQTSNALTQARNSFKEFSDIQKNLNDTFKNVNIAELTDEQAKGFSESIQRMISEEEKFNTAMKQVKAEETATLAPGVALRAANEMQSYINNNSKAWSKYKTKLEEVRDAYKQVTTEGEKLAIDAKARDLKAEISAAGLTGSSIFQDTKRAVGQIAQFTGAYAFLQNAMLDLPSKVVTNVKEINDAQIELTKVASDASESQLSQYWDEAADSAKKYGATVSDVISSTADWSRLGYSLSDAKELSNMTTLLQRVGDNMTQESSSEGLISTLRGFELNADSAEHIVNVANEIANTQPIDTAGIFAALQRSASSLNAGGNSFEQAVALTTAANSVVQDSDKIGTALKTISMRIRSASTDLENAGLDTEGMVTSTAKLRKEILALSGVDIMKNANEFKSTYDILDELSNKWSSLTDIQQANTYTCLYA